MEASQQVGPMPAEQRAELKRLAEAVTGEIARGAYHSATRGAFRSALTPAVVLATLTYVEALESKLEGYRIGHDGFCEALDMSGRQLAAAEARATEAAAEAGKWQQRHGELQQELAEQEVQALALIEVLATASAKEFLDNAEIKEMVEDPRVAGRWTLFRRGMEHGANELARKALGMKEAPAPVAPQQQEGGGQ